MHLLNTKPQRPRSVVRKSGSLRFCRTRGSVADFGVRHYQLVSFAVDVDDLYRGVVFQQLAQLGDVDIHAAGVEVIVVYPDGLQRIVALQYVVYMVAEQCEQLALLGGEFLRLVAVYQNLLLGVESELA